MKYFYIKLRKLTTSILIASFSFLIFSDCARNPVTGKKELSFMSLEQEKALGKQSDPSIIATYGLYENDELQAFINEKGKEMAAVSHRPDLDYQFRILDSPIINAFAVPGGYVYFTRGILAHFNNEAEFAGVLGHEIGHITARHSAKQYTRQILGQIGLVAGLVLSEDFRAMANEASQAMQLIFLKFGRDQESQSDKLGVEYSSKIGYDAKHMANFFNTLHQMRLESGSTMPTFLSTHPDPLDRYEKVGAMANKYQSENAGQYATNRDKYLKMIDGLIYGEDPRQGYVENNVFYHPELKFQFPVPAGWKVNNSPQQVQIVNESGEAGIILMLAQEKTVEEAGNKFVENNKLTAVDARKTTINGLPAYIIISDQYPETAQQQGAAQNQAYQQQAASAPNKGKGGNGTPTKTDKESPNSGKVPTKTSTTSRPPITVNTGDNSSDNQPNPKQPSPNPNPNVPRDNVGTGGQGQGGPTPTLRIQSTMIEYNGLIYGFHGLAKFADYQQLEPSLRISGSGFKKLTDVSKMNVKPSRLSIKTVRQNSSLVNALKSLGVPSEKMDEHALINGMKLDDQVKSGSLLKVVEK